MFVHQSPRRHSARLQNAYEDGTAEDEQHLLQPEERNDHLRSALGGGRSSPQDYHPRHTQLYATSRTFADQRHADNDAPSGPDPNASFSAHNAGEAISETAHADPAHNAGDAASPPTALPSYQSHTRTSGAAGTYARPPPSPGYYYSDSPYPEPAAHDGRGRPLLTQLAQAALPANTVADGHLRSTRTTASHAAQAASRAEHRHHQPQRMLPAFDSGGGRGLSSSSSEPIDREEDLEQKSAFYRNATFKPKPDPHFKPNLDLPKFDGNIRQYGPFREAFDYAIGLDTGMRPLHKLLYLRQLLSGEPLTLAVRYSLTDVNYTHVIKLLDKTYGNKARLLFTLQQDLYNVKPPSEEPSDLRRFHDELDRIQSSLRYAGETLESGHLKWATVLVKKLPTPLRVKLVETYGYNPYNFSAAAFLECLDSYVTTLEWATKDLLIEERPDEAPTQHSVAVDTSDLSSPQCRDDPELPRIEPAPQRVPTAVDTTIADGELKERRTCPLCGLLHSAADCTVYETTNRRLRRAMKLNLCLLCLREGHPAVSCPRRTTRPCPTCRRGQHSRALCKNANQRNDRHPSKVRATGDSSCDPKASDQQRYSRTSVPAKRSCRIAEQSVIRDVTSCVTIATTLRQSGTQSSRESSSGNLINRKKRTKDLGTDPPGRTGTNRPPTTSTDESIKQHGAEAYGSDRLLPGRYNHLQTDTCSTNREMLQFDRALSDGSDEVPDGMPDEKLSRELYDEDASHQPSEGLRTDAVTKPSPDVPDETRFPPNEESTAYIACASDSDEQPVVLHECLAVTAMNPASNKSRRAVIMFDSGSSSSHVSSKLAQCLDLPRHEMRVQHVSTFGSDTPLVFNGFRTFLVLCSKHGRSIQVNVTVLDRIVPSVRTALVRDADLSALRSGDCVPTPTREMPDLLIGQDLVHLFDRHLDPTLPCGFYIVQTSMGPTIGGACLSVRPPPKASSTSPPAALAATQDTDTIKHTSRWSLTPPASKFKPPSSRLHLRLQELAAYRDRDSDDEATQTGRGSPVPAHNAGLEPSDAGNNEENQPEFPAHNAGALDFPRAEPPEIPAHNAGSGGSASHAVTTTTAASDRPSGPRKKKEASPEAKPPSAQAAPAAQLTEKEPALLGFQCTNEQSAVVSSSSSGPVDTTDPTAPPALTTELCRELTKDEIMIHDPAPGVKLRVLGIDPTGFYLVNCAEYDKAFRGQWTASVRLARAALVSGKCLSLCITKDQNSGDVDLHDEARKALHKIENRLANNAGDTAVHKTDEYLGSSTSTSFSSRQPLQPSRVSSALPLSPQKQSSTNPLDAQLLLLPAHSITYVEVEEVTAAHNAAGLPRPTQEPLSSTEAELHCSSPSPPTYGNVIRAPLHEAGSHRKRKTRLRCRLPVRIRQPLGIYAARKLIFTVLPLPQLEPTYFHLLGAEHGQKLVLMSSPSPQPTIMLRTRLSRHLRALFQAVLLRDAHVAVLCGYYRATLQQHDATVTDGQRTLDWIGSRRDCLRWLRSPRSLATHAREPFDPPSQDSAHQQSPAPTALDAPPLGDLEPTPQPLAFQPAGPPSACLSPPPPTSTLSRVRIDPHPTLPALGPADATLRCWLHCILAPAACGFSSRSSKRVRVLVFRLPLAVRQYLRRLKRSCLATTYSTMGRRKSKNIKTHTHFPAVPAGSAFHRMHGRGASEDVITGEELVAEHSPTVLSTEITRDDEPPSDISQGASVPAHNAGLMVSATRYSATATTSVIPAHNAGSQVPAQDKGRPRGHRSKLSTTLQLTSTKAAKRTGQTRQPSVKRPLNPPKEKRSSTTAKPPAKATPSATEQTTLPPVTRVHAQASPSGPQCRSVNLSCGTNGHPRDSGPQCRFSRTRNRGPTRAVPPAKITKVPPKLPDEQLSPAEIAHWEHFDIEHARQYLHAPCYARTDAAFREEIEFSWNSWCMYHPKAPLLWTEAWSLHKLDKHLWARYLKYGADVAAREAANLNDLAVADTNGTATVDEPQSVYNTGALEAYRHDLAVDAVRFSQAPRGPRADLVDQELRRWPADPAADSTFSRTHHQATRATQEPLEPLTVAAPLMCAFCGRFHLWCECDVYTNDTQRLQRASQLERCLSCLGEGHHESACSATTTTKRSLISHDQHHGDPRRDAIASKSLTQTPSAAPSAAAAVANHPTSTSMRRTCAFCQSPHWSIKCNIYVSIGQRIRRARKLELCFVCLRKGHHVTSCPCEAHPCKFCSKGTHHRALCCSCVTNHRSDTKLPTNRAAKQPTNDSANGTAKTKKRVMAASIRVNDHNACQPNHETICFCDASTVHQFGCQLRSKVRMVETPTTTPADASKFVCSFGPASEVKRVIFWFGSVRDSQNHVSLVRMIIELSHYYATHYETIVQYVVVSPSVNSRQDVWTYGIFKYLVQARVLLPDARLTMLPHDRLVHDGLVTANGHLITNPPKPTSCSVEDVKHYMREQYQLDLWSSYRRDNPPPPGTAEVAAHNAAPQALPTSRATVAAAHKAVTSDPAPTSLSATIADQNPCVQDTRAATDAKALSKLSATRDAAISTDAPAIAATAASHHRRRGHSDRRRRRRDQEPAPHTDDFEPGPRAP